MTREEILGEAFGLGMVQSYYEISQAHDFVKSLGIRDFMEIGTDQGGTFLVWSRISGQKGLKISVDLANGPWGVRFDVEKRNAKLRTLGDDVHILDGSSHSEDMYYRVKSILGDRKLDFLFIDGDHSYLGVKLDYVMYKEFVKPGGWIGFHDIKDCEFHRRENCYVNLLWDELRGEKIWYLSSDHEGFGIGFIRC